jgi:hypothetical protein
MSEPIDELKVITADLSNFSESFRSADFMKTLDRLREAAQQVGQSWSGSWEGYQAHVYYANLKPPPPGHHFSSEWGLAVGVTSALGGTHGDWRELPAEQVEAEIYRRAGNPDLVAARKAAEAGTTLFNKRKEDLLSILHALAASSSQPYLQKLLDEANAVELFDRRQLIQAMRPKGTFMTLDALAASQGTWIPPHISAIGDTADIEGPAVSCETLATVARKTFSYLERTQRNAKRDARVGTNFFIGHGGSKVWKDLKDFVQDRLHLPWDEFNRVPVAGTTNIARLSEMLDDAAVAFIVMTAEDELLDGKVQARMNVVHEAGLFQGRLGFTKAIVLLEKGCEEFSNIEGLGQIRFPKGNIGACFEEIRRVLEREGIS